MTIASPIIGSHAGEAPALANAAMVFPDPALQAPVALLAAPGERFGSVDHSWPNTQAGQLAQGHGEITWFERIHVEPYYSDLGFLVSAQTIVVRVWNADRNAARIASGYTIAGDEGTSLDNPPSFPLQWMPGQQRSFDYLVTEDGPPTFANQLIFHFAGFLDVETDLNIEGVRVVPFSIDPSGAILERYGYLTRILSSHAQHEQRAALRSIPRRSWSFDFVLVGRDHRLAQALLHGWSAQPFGLPIWYEETRLTAQATAGATSIACDTTLRDWDELAILWSSPHVWEAVLIESVAPSAITLGAQLQATWPANTRLYPMRLARIEARQVLERRGLETAVMRTTFQGEDWRRS